MTIDTKALRERFEEWYVANTFDYGRNPIGSRECAQQWGAWLEAHRQAADRLAALEAETQVLKEFLDCRAGRLLVRGEPFFVVKASEPYARQVVELIKQHEGECWTEEDEQWAGQALASGGDK